MPGLLGRSQRRCEGPASGSGSIIDKTDDMLNDSLFVHSPRLGVYSTVRYRENLLCGFLDNRQSLSEIVTGSTDEKRVSKSRSIIPLTLSQTFTAN